MVNNLEVGLGAVDFESTPIASSVAALLLVFLAGAYSVERGQWHAKTEPEDAKAGRSRRHHLEERLLEDEAPSKPQKGGGSGLFAAMAANSEETREIVALSVSMLAWSAFLIYVNAYILDDLCPYPATLTMVQQVFGFCAALGCVYGLHVCEPVDMSVPLYVKYIVPMGGCFAVYLWGGNNAYLYVTPGFMQMLKPVAGPITYLVTCAHDPSMYTHWKLANVLVIFGGIGISAATDDAAGGSSNVIIGGGMLIVAYVCAGAYNVSLQVVQQSGWEIRLNPITTLLYVGPVSALFLAGVAGATEWNGGDFHCFDKLPWWLLALDCLVAFGFNIGMLRFVGRLSAVSYSIFGLFKDIFLVLMAFVFFREHIPVIVIEGWIVAIAGVCVWQHRKLCPLPAPRGTD